MRYWLSAVILICFSSMVYAAPLIKGTDLSTSFVIPQGSTIAAPGNSPATPVFVLTPSSVSVRGVTDGSNACPGCIGEVAMASAPLTNFTTSGNYGDLAFFTLTAGDWDVSSNCILAEGGVTVTVVLCAITTVSGNSGSGVGNGDNMAQQNAAVNLGAILSLAIPVYRVSITASTIYYLKYYASYAGGTPTMAGRMSARRVR